MNNYLTSEEGRPTRFRKAGSADATEVAEMVGKEILETRLEPGAWATALAECEGRKQEAIGMYAKLRMERLKPTRRLQSAKGESFEARRLAKCIGVIPCRPSMARSVQDMLQSPERGKEMNFLKPKLSVIWVFALMLGAAGSVASVGRLAGLQVPGLSVLAALLVLGGVFALRAWLPKRWIMLGWNSGMVTACNVVCLMSLVFGAKIVKDSGSSAARVAVHQAVNEEFDAPNEAPKPVSELYVLEDPIPVVAQQP